MQSTLKPKQDDDPHDFLVIASDGVAAAPAREQAPSLSPDAVRRPLDSETLTGPGFAAAPPVRPVDATFRPATVDDIQPLGQRRWIARRIVRAVMAVLLTVGAAVIAQHSYGDAAKQMIATWVPPSALSWLPLEKLGLAAPSASPAAAPDAAQAQAPQAATPAPAAPDASAPAAASVSADTAQLMQSMAHDIAGLGQQIEQLKAGIDQLKAGQDQLSRDVAKASERASEKVARIAPPPPPPVVPARPVAPRPRKPPPAYPLPQAATAPAVPPPAAAPYYPPPRQVQPPPDAANAPLPDPELSSAPRPPMPLR
jgi:hypothetical protein